MEKVIAVVVSYNRQMLLSKCIAALKAQTHPLDAILVINNGSTDGTEAWLKSQQDILFITQENIGSGGGFHSGIEWAFKNNYSWIWCMDDDGYPKEDALEKILAPQKDNLCLRNCAVINKDDKKSFVWKTKNYASIADVDTEVIDGIGHPFNGTLIHRTIIERVGLPKANLFLWGDESEYYHRITSKNNIPVCTITGSIHYHPAAVFTFKKDWDFKNSWKMYFYVRNRFHIQQSKFNNKAVVLLNYCFFLTALAGIVLLYQKTDKVKKLGFISWPAIDALRNDFSQDPQTILMRLNSTSSARLSTAMNNYIKYTRLALAALFTLPGSSKTANA